LFRSTVEFSGATADGAVVEFCRERACATVEQSVGVAAGGLARPATALTPGVHWWRVRGRVGARPGVRASAVWQFTVPRRDAAGADTAGGAIPDFNGDGRPDLAVGEPQGAHPDRAADGFVHVFVNAGDGRGTLAVGPVLNRPRVVTGGFGASVAACDLDRDGFVDLAVGSRAAVTLFRGGPAGVGATPWRTLAAYSGALCAGDALVAWNTSGAARVRGPSFDAGSTTALGAGVGVSVGDVDGDRTVDVGVLRGGTVVVTLLPRSRPARTVTLRAPAGAVLLGAATVGDFNGDGYADLAASGRLTAGSTLPDRVYLYAGGAAGPSAAPTRTFTGPMARELGFGTGLGGAGDVNGDGFDDLVVGTGQNSNSATNYVHVVLGLAGADGTARVVTRTFGGLGRYGSTVGRAGDLDGDGYGDVLVGNRGNSDSIAGAVRIFPGAGAAVLADGPSATLRGASTNGGFSTALAGWQ
ncbi:MAG: putative integrin-like protein, partial [Myxococcaceae bacterium]|nr:putative integrin-like protein [Myxococcaceae bacterium]